MGTIRGAQVAFGKNNRVHVAWNGSGAARPEGPINPEAGKPGAPMMFSRMDKTGKAFEPQRNLMKKTFGLDGGGSVADADGNVYVAWHGKAMDAAKGETGRQVWLVRSSDNGKSFSKTDAGMESAHRRMWVLWPSAFRQQQWNGFWTLPVGGTEEVYHGTFIC